MNLRDLIYEKESLTRKIEDLTNILVKQPDDNIAGELVSLIDRKQKLILDIKNANSQCVLNLGESSIDLNTAVVIRSSIKAKINILSKLIGSMSLDALDLIEQRDRFLKDYAVLDMGIINVDINTKLS